MAVALTYGEGRGAFPTRGLGGTLSYDGLSSGPYYRAPASARHLMPGLIGALAVRRGNGCSINDYAVYSAVKSLQRMFGMPAHDIDGIFGSDTTYAARVYQAGRSRIKIDGVVGPQTCQVLFKPIVEQTAFDLDQPHAGMLIRIASGTVKTESNYDLGAVGVVTPEDLGIGQINGTAHPNMSVDARLDPMLAIPWLVSFIDNNLQVMAYDEDAAIASYLLGIAGAQAWMAKGRPQLFRGADIWAYIAKVKAGG